MPIAIYTPPVATGPSPFIWYKLDETSGTIGTTFVDSSGNGYDASNTGGGTLTVNQPPLINDGGTSFDFDSSGDFETPFDPAFNSIVCVECWIQPHGIVIDEYSYPIIMWCDLFPGGGAASSTNGFQLERASSTQGIQFRTFDPASTTTYVNGATGLSPGTNYHVVVNFGYNLGDPIEIFLNGVSDGIQPVVATWSLGGNIIRTGQGTNTGTGFISWDGFLDDVKFYTAQLTPAQVLANYNNQHL